MSSIPKSFFPFLTTFADFSRKKVKINTIGKDTAAPGELTTILLPEGKIDLSTFSLGGLITAGGTTGSANAPPVEALIDQIMIEVGSVQLHPSFNMYGVVWTMFSDIQGSWNKKNIRSILNLQPTAVPAANQTNVPFQLSNWLGFMNDCKILNTDRLPPVRVTIRWAQNNVLGGSAGVVGATYSLSKLYALVDMVKLSPVYDELLSAKIAQSPLQIPYTNYQVIPGIQGNTTNTTRFSSTSDSLQKIYGTFIPSNYMTLNQVADAVTYMSPAFNRGAPSLGSGFTARFTINGNSFPDQPVYAERGEILQQTLEAMGESHDVTSQPHPNLNSLANFNTKFFVHANSFTYDSDGADAASRKCGLSALGQNLMGSWETIATVNDTTVMPLVILECKSVLEVGAGRTVRVVY